MESSSDVGKYLPGDVVLTAYGAGVLTACPTDADADSQQTYQVRIWRIPEKSIGSSSLAHLQADAIVRKLPAAPGLVTCTKSNPEKQLMVYSYSATRNVFVVSRHIDNNSGGGARRLSVLSNSSSEIIEEVEEKTPVLFEVAAGDLIESPPAAKFYPLLQELMTRGDQAATVTAEFVQSETVSKLVQQSQDYVKDQSSDVISSSTEIDVKTVLPKEEDVKQLYTMLKDEELTVLLEKGKERLQQLVDKDVPQATELALGKAGSVIASSDQTDFDSIVSKSRESALAAIEQLLASNNAGMDVSDIQDHLKDEFSNALNSLSQAAQSDRTLSSIMEDVSQKTEAWQKATGQLMNTKSFGLFLEGASRLQARATDILFSNKDLQILGNNFTKAFTEGDAAVARLKGLELGDAVRSRLVTAIEVRSESHGGLDGIIAGALTNLGDMSGNENIQDFLAGLQNRASEASQDTQETLLSVLSEKSQYRDAALLQIERVLCGLESQLGDDLSPSEIAALARGEGGTAMLFEPIARRAAKEIEKQLDVAEASVTDETILGGLKNVRKIISGELSIAGLLDEVVKVLNDDNVVAVGESLVKHGETVLDAIEGVSGNKVVGDVMEIAEKAGITKDSVMSQMESLNVNEILDTAGNAVSDEQARKQLISSATDVALDFLLRILPSMPVPPFDGVKDGLLYSLSNLSMEGFKVRKENILVEVAGMRATKTSPIATASSHASDENSSMAQGSFSTLEEILWSNSRGSDNSDKSFEGDEIITIGSQAGGTKATELLIIDVKKISAVLDDASWSFEQTYMPYLKGSGKANVRLSDGAIRLQFELRKKRASANEGDGSGWEPVLCLHGRSCSIGQVDLVLQGEGRITWIFNKLVSIFKGPLRDYVVRTIVTALSNRSGFVLEQLNKNLSPFWGLIMRTAKLTMDDLVEASADDITAALPSEEDSLMELVWRESLPLGMNLLLNDDSGMLKVVDFPRGSQARSVCVQRQLDPEIFNGSAIVAVNGSRFDTREELFAALKDPGRPKSILFELAEQEDAERVKRFVEGPSMSRGQSSVEDREQNRERGFSVRTVDITDERALGIEFASAIDGIGLVVCDFLQGDDGIVLAAERHSDEIRRGDLLTHVNGTLVLGKDGKGKQLAISMLEDVGDERPLSLSFTENYLFCEKFEKDSDGVVDFGGPDEFRLKEKQLSSSTKRVVLEDYENICGMAEAGGVLIGDHLIFINGVPVGAGCRLVGGDSPELQDVYKMIRDESAYPIGLTFARPKQTERSWKSTPTKSRPFDVDSAETICITADRFGYLGCVFENSMGVDVVISDLFAVPGPIQQKMQKYMDSCLSIESINGQFVPSYANPDIVKNAMKRSWMSSGRFEVLFCDDSKKNWVQNLK